VNPNRVRARFALLLCVCVAPAIASAAAATSTAAPAAAPCRAEVVAAETGDRRQAFVAWLKANAAKTGGEVGDHAAADDLGRFDLRIADIDNDGSDEYVLTAYGGSGGYLDLSVFRRAGAGWTAVAQSPLDEALEGVHDYFDPVSNERQVLVRFCGKTYLTLLGGGGPNYAREAWLWEGGKVRLVCDAPWLDEQRRFFQGLFDGKHYDEAHAFLDGVQAVCKREAAPQTWLWMQSDLALAAYRMGTFADCLRHVAAAEKSPHLARASASLRQALRTNAGLCHAAKGTIAPADLAWLLDLKTDPADQVVLDPRFNGLLSAIVPDAKVDGEALRDMVKHNLYLPESVKVIDRRYVVLAGCRPHDCESKGFAWIDTVAGKSLVAVNGLVASMSFEPAAIPAEAWAGIGDAIGLADEQPLTFIGRDGRAKQIQAPPR
jgi:hypothetical protein